MPADSSEEERQERAIASSHLGMKVAVTQLYRFFVTPQTVARQVPLSMGILQASMLEWVAIPFSRGSSQPRDQTWVSCIGRWVLYCLNHEGSPTTER